MTRDERTELDLLREIVGEMTDSGLSGWGSSDRCVSCGRHEGDHNDDCAFARWKALRRRE
jgi:hypothetical protein